jgi:RNA polymerase sigma-70 factor, ECF subfamily
MNSSDDLELLRQAQLAPDGDTRAFEELLRLHHKKILANCRFLTRDNSNYEDLAQEVFVKAYFGLKSFEGNSTFGHWLRRIKVNHCLNHLKRKEGKTVLDITDPALEIEDRLQAPATVEADLDAAAHGQRIQQVLSSLPITLRVPLVMRDMDGFSYEEAAQSLGIGLSAVKMRIKRGREEFRRLYSSLTPPKDPG